jgi:FtsP/CotA-like multicopper oxidase with cupredoxin domain
MRSTPARLGLLAAALAAAVVLFIVLKGDGDDGGGETAGATQVLTVDKGEPAGGVKTLTYAKGDQVRIEVRLNTPEEEIHVHGYEIEKPAEKSPVELSFPANLDGVFEIEVHRPDGSEGEIAELHVNP